MEIARHGKSGGRRGARGRAMLSESTLSTSNTVCQFLCSDLEGTRLATTESLPPSPSSPLLFLDAAQIQQSSNRRKQMQVLD